ncbi:MAG: hypothetical protein GY854_31560 [Deltaproteobacteria bacterium]|nr:hypothetical protein [Deltaproteobacteria bacterium]
MSKHITVFASALLATIAAIGCTALTDFEEPNDSEPYSLQDNLNDPVVVTILDNGNATISLELMQALPETEEGDDTGIAALLGDAVQLEVRAESGITVNLTQGKRVTAEPSAPGEYRVTLNNARDKAEIVFRNETTGGQSLNADGVYEAAISIPNPSPQSYFETENFTRAIHISN